MSMYTEIIFGARLKSNTPKEIIDIIKTIVSPDSMISDETENVPDHPFF